MDGPGLHGRVLALQDPAIRCGQPQRPPTGPHRDTLTQVGAAGDLQMHVIACVSDIFVHRPDFLITVCRKA